jgi:ribonuclease VapC
LANPAVFDASALLAVLYGEPGASKAIDALHGALVSSVNLSEIHARLLRRGLTTSRPGDRDHLWTRVLSMGFEVVPFSGENARLAAEILIEQPKAALSLGERACLALAIERGATVYTTNAAWRNLPLNIDVEVIA